MPLNSSVQNMSKPPRNAAVPLLCSLCPKNPQFSDISHLLTHISSKGHLSCRFKLQIRCQAEPEARSQLDAYDAWYANNSLEELLAERLATKEQKNTLKRMRSFQNPQIKEDKGGGETHKSKVEQMDSTISQLMTTPVYKPPVPRMHIWSTSPAFLDTPSGSVASNRWDRNDAYATPTMKRFVPNFTRDESPGSQDIFGASPAPVKPAEFQADAESDNSKLKGVYWPGMDLFDSATAEMKRMRNQRKDGSILAQMKTTSREVEPNEIIYNTQGELQRVRDIYDSSVEGSPVNIEKPPSPKKRRARKPKTSSDIPKHTVCDSKNPAKGGKQKRPSVKRKAAAVAVAVAPAMADDTALNQKVPKQNALGDISSNFFTPTNDEDEEFRLTVETMGKKRRMSVFKDAVEDSPGRTESPLEDHRFDFSHGLPLENASSNMIVPTSPRAIQSPLTMRFGGKENMQPDYLIRRSGAASAPGNVYPPHAFHEHTANPLIYNPYSYTIGFNESPAFHGDYKQLQTGFTGDFKPTAVPGSFREPNSARRQNRYVNKEFSYAIINVICEGTQLTGGRSLLTMTELRAWLFCAAVASLRGTRPPNATPEPSSTSLFHVLCQQDWKMAPPNGKTAAKQRSISSFFTPKSTVNGLSQKQGSPDQATQSTPSTAPVSSGLGTIDDADSDEDVIAPTRRSVSTTSKRKGPLDEDADALNVGTDRAAKRTKSGGNDTQSSFFEGDTSNQSPRQPENKSTLSGRTDRYLYNGTQSQEAFELAEPEAEAVQRQKQRLHDKFVKKLGHPDSMAHIKRRNWQITEETAALDDEDAEAAEDEEPAPPAKGARKATKSKLTPMEIQFLDIKRKHLDAILIVEVGYKFKFFGEDARVAAKELGIVCIPGKFRYDEHPSEAHLDRFATASIPVHRLPVHAKRLVAAGHKVGVVRQIETAALKKAGDNRNTPFVRKLTNLYTKGTYIDDTEGLGDATAGTPGGAPATGYLLCITETKSKGWGTDEKVDVGILAVQPGTGDVIYDSFEDGFMRSEIETRLLHISPCEFLIIGELTKATEKLVQHLSSSSTNVFGDKIRIERVEKQKTIAAESYAHVAQFYARNIKAHGNSADERSTNLLDKVLKLPESVTICLSSMIKHMSEYGLEHVFDLTKYFQSFGARSNMLLNGNTLTSLEIYHNQTDHAEKGSLFWTLDKTQTRFGKRLLRKWVGRPLIDKERLEERVAAVEELKDGNQAAQVDKLKSLLMKVKSDLERSLIRIYYGKCTRPELFTVLQTMQRISNEFAHVKSPADAGFKSSLLNDAVAALPTIGDAITDFLEKINAEAARNDDKYAFFLESEETEDIGDHKLGIAVVEHDLDEHRPIAAAKIKKTNIRYVTSAGIEFLIEVDNTNLKHVPASWVKVSGTKKLSRFHTPEVIKMIRERDQHKEALAAACDAAFSNLLSEIAAHYQAFRDCVASLATLDCLLSLATVASQPGYVKPEYTSETEIAVVGGRHPMAEQLLLDSYVPNDTSLSADGTRALLITGPNMGGKSSYVRHVALICIMAQIGSYVPAESARLGMLDAVFTRMGAFDNMLAGESTFMVELSETADILKQATPRSLVILDELGRGTSTHDGVAIAQAVLDYVVRDLKCLTLFITHYQTLAGVARAFGSWELRNVHMKFTEQGRVGEEDITFLFQIGEGVAHRSYGLNVARLARIPRGVLEVAKEKSGLMEEENRRKLVGGLAGLLGRVVGGGVGDGELDLLVKGIEQL
ncbi:hypothetical protein V493_03038 [Pseudogymnoascus sp. VKM F-4281 (FW-2241)]|nr:hypothetical protein V493_03038 [Pseudogymnoascus sp. VKM F-4281 (FW-2241)]